MTNTVRDTKFADFARLLFQDVVQIATEETSLGQNLEGWRQVIEKRIAQRAYDLAYLILKEVDILGLHGYPHLDTLKSIIALDISAEMPHWPIIPDQEDEHETP